MNLREACEIVARQRERVGEEYRVCGLEVEYPKGYKAAGRTDADLRTDWVLAKVRIGRKVEAHWIDIRDLRIKFIEVAHLLDAPDPPRTPPAAEQAEMRLEAP